MVAFQNPLPKHVRESAKGHGTHATADLLNHNDQGENHVLPYVDETEQEASLALLLLARAFYDEPEDMITALNRLDAAKESSPRLTAFCGRYAKELGQARTACEKNVDTRGELRM